VPLNRLFLFAIYGYRCVFILVCRVVLIAKIQTFFQLVIFYLKIKHMVDNADEC
jgi:hypothetical protein